MLLILGAAAGIASFLWTLGWQWNQNVKSYVQLSLTLNAANPETIIASMTVENRGQTRKKISYAALLVTQHDQPLVYAAKELVRCAQAANFDGSDSVMALLTLPHPEKTLACSGNLIEPVPFLYREQQDIGDERIGCESTISASSLKPGTQYDVRFLVFDNSSYRSTQAVFFTPAAGG
jgi:hypothetical protein